MIPLPFVLLFLWIGVPLLIAAIIGYALRMPDYIRRIVLVLYSIAFCLWATFPFTGVFKLGIDLSGGTILLYQVKQPTPAQFSLDKMLAAIQRRVNPIGMTDITIRGVGANRIEIIIPEATKEEVDRCKRVLTDLGSLEFRILANQRDHRGAIERALETLPEPLLEDGRVIAKWFPIAPDSRGSFADGYGQIEVREFGQSGRYVLAMQDEYQVTGEFLQQATSTVDERLVPAVGFRFNNEGARRFAALTGENVPDADGFERRLAIILNGEVRSAPSLRSQIDDQGVITGRFTQQEVDDLITVLNAGALPGELDRNPVSELTVGPTLGRDTVQSGLWAIAIASGVVFAFMLVYYRIAGLIADLAVVLNVGLVVAVMVWLKASFTLPGLAGLALTIGMAVDANVLIFERLREEQEAGRKLRMAIRMAFYRALRPILDSNITTLLTGVMLYAIGSEQVRGFALTLVLGLVANLFTAVFVCRLVFDILEGAGWIKRFGMFRLLRKPHWDFMRMRFWAVGASTLLIVIGLTAVGLRGKDLFDIDFTGGTLAAVQLKQPSDSATVRNLVSQQLPDVSVEELRLRDEPAGRHYQIRTTLVDQREVRRRLGEALRDYVVSPRMTADELEQVLIAAGEAMAKEPVLERLDNFGSQVASEARGLAALALLAGMAVIVIYLWIRFQNVLFGLGAVIALLHDVLIVLGLVGLSRWLSGNSIGDALLLETFKIDLPMVAAFLTLVGYSVNDTIVVFDRIRESRKGHEPLRWQLLNNCINQTLSRTLLTGLTTWLVALILYAMGGQGIHGFAFILVAGVVVGTYSSVYIASPVLIWLGGRNTTNQTKGT